MDRSFPPAWYPDPRDAEMLRRWDGRRWTADTRPCPAWLRELRPVAGPVRRRVPSRSATARRLWSASTVTFLSAVILLLSLLSSWRSTTTVERVADTSFLAAAAETCERAEREVLEPYRRSRTKDPAALAIAVERFVDELRVIDVDSADEAAVDRWIAAWDDWTRAGHAYAEAVAAGDGERAGRITERSYVARSVISRFAYANGLSSCAL